MCGNENFLIVQNELIAYTFINFYRTNVWNNMLI